MIAEQNGTFSTFAYLRYYRPGRLWRLFKRVHKEGYRPAAFVVENVPPMLKSAEGQELMKKTREIGYDVDGRILNAADFGACQVRKRTIILGSRDGDVVFPKQTHADPTNGAGTRHNLKDWVTVKDSIGDLPFIPSGESLHFGRNPRPISRDVPVHTQHPEVFRKFHDNVIIPQRAVKVLL